MVQLPDDLLQAGGRLITHHLKPQHPEKYFTIACDNCRNPCCVDFTAAAHIEADLFLKVGRSCRSEVVDRRKTRVEFIEQARDLQTGELAAEAKRVGELAHGMSMAALVVFVDTSLFEQLSAIKEAFRDVEDRLKTRYLYVQPREDGDREWSERRLLSASGFRRLQRR